MGIFVCMLMIATVVPVTGTIQENEHKNSMLNQNNKTVLSRMEWSICIGLITNRTFLGDSYIRFNCVFLIYMGRFDGRYGFEIFHSREPFYFERGSGIRLIGRHFAFFISENGRPWLPNDMLDVYALMLDF
jgi:hypothetical protein